MSFLLILEIIRFILSVAFLEEAALILEFPALAVVSHRSCDVLTAIPVSKVQIVATFQ